MNKTSPSQKRDAFWRNHLQTWSDSSLSQTDYCRTHDLALHQFSYWKRKTSGKPDQPTDNAGFAQVDQAHGDRKGSDLSIALPNGLMIRGIDQKNFAVAAQLLQALQ